MNPNSHHLAIGLSIAPFPDLGLPFPGLGLKPDRERTYQDWVDKGHAFVRAFPMSRLELQQFGQDSTSPFTEWEDLARNGWEEEVRSHGFTTGAWDGAVSRLSAPGRSLFRILVKMVQSGGTEQYPVAIITSIGLTVRST